MEKMGKEMLALAKLPKEIIYKNIEEILKHKPDYIPEFPEVKKEVKLQPELERKLHLDPEFLKRKEKLQREGTYYGWFYIMVSSPYTWYWALETNCETDTGCTQTKLPCNTYADIHQEHFAWDDTYQRHCSMLFNAACANPDCGVFHLRPDYDNFPTSDDWYYCGVNVWEHGNCISLHVNELGKTQAVVVYWPYG